MLSQLCACGGVRSLFGGQLRVDFRVAPASNQNSPVAVDLIALYDKKLLEALQQVSAHSWFAGEREQFLRDHPGEADLEVHHWEWVPGQEVGVQSLRFRPRVKGVVLFADYFSPGQHRAVIDPRQAVVVRLGATGFTVEAAE